MSALFGIGVDLGAIACAGEDLDPCPAGAARAAPQRLKADKIQMNASIRAALARQVRRASGFSVDTPRDASVACRLRILISPLSAFCSWT